MAQATIVEDCPALPSSVVTWAVTATFDAFQHAKDKVYDSAAIGDAATAFLAFGEQLEQQHFDEAHAYRDVIGDAYDALFERSSSSILVTPTLGCEAFPHGTIHPLHIADTPIEMPWLDWAGFLYDANLAGLPACVIPMGLGSEGLPLSLQILGPAGSDDEVLRVAEAIEALIGWQYSIAVPPDAHDSAYLLG